MLLRLLPLQFSNVVLTNCVERIIHNTQYADRELGVNLVRGEAIVMMGEVVRWRATLCEPCAGWSYLTRHSRARLQDPRKEAAMNKVMQKSKYEEVYAARELKFAALRAAGKRADELDA